MSPYPIVLRGDRYKRQGLQWLCAKPGHYKGNLYNVTLILFFYLFQCPAVSFLEVDAIEGLHMNAGKLTNFRVHDPVAQEQRN